MQGVFEGFYRDEPVRPIRPEAVFFALRPDSKTARFIAEIAKRFIRDHHLVGKRIEERQLHVSLEKVGNYSHLPTKFIDAARRAGDAVVMRPFEIEFNAIMSLAGAPPIDGQPRRTPLVLMARNEALSNLHKTLGAAMQTNGLRAPSRFTPHLTFFYGPEVVPWRAIEQPIRFTVNEFMLIHSEQGMGRHNTLDRWQLRG